MRILVLLSFIASLTTCKHEEPKAAFDFYPPIPDSLRNKSILKEFENIERQFNLPTIYHGVDSFEIRIYPWSAFGDGDHLLVFKLDSTGWTGHHYYSYTLLRTSPDGAQRRRTYNNKLGDNVFTVKELQPKSGWKNFNDSLILYTLNELPNQEKIKNFKHVFFFDGHGYSIEISTPRSFRFVSYYMPEAYPYEECKTISSFISFLKRQFVNDYTWPSNSPPVQR